MLPIALILATATSIGGIEDLVLAHPGDLEIPRLHHAITLADSSGVSWQGVVLGGASGYGDEDPAGFGALGAEVAAGGPGGARPSLFGGIVGGDLSSWLAGVAIHGHRALGARTMLQFRGSYAYQARFVDDPFDVAENDIRFIVPIPGTELDPPTEAEIALDEVSWNRYRVDASFARTLTQSARSRAALVVESGVHLTQHRFEGVNDTPLSLDILYPPGSYRTTESESVWSAPIGAFLVWRSTRIGAALGVRSDFEFESALALLGATVTI